MDEKMSYIKRDENRPKSFARTRFLPDGAPVGREILEDRHRQFGKSSYRKGTENNGRVPVEKHALLSTIREKITLSENIYS